jgi:hypothetical protein
MVYRKNHLLTDYNKRYLIARKQTYLLYQCNVWFRVNIGICYSCNQLVYSKLRSGYEYFHAFFMDKHWRTNCTGNEYCDMSFEDYMKLKNNPSPCYFMKKAIHRYEMWLENVSNRIRRIRAPSFKELRGRHFPNQNRLTDCEISPTVLGQGRENLGWISHVH